MVSSGHWGLHKGNWSWGFRDVGLRDVLSLVVSRGCHLPVSYVAGIIGERAAAEWELEREEEEQKGTKRSLSEFRAEPDLISCFTILGYGYCWYHLGVVMGNVGALHHRVQSVIVLPVHGWQYFYYWGLSYLYSIPGDNLLSFISSKVTLKFSNYTIPSVHHTESQSPHYHHTIAASQPAHQPVYDTQILGTYHQN